MPSLNELKALAELIVSDDLDTEEFILYYNFCMHDLSEIINFEKDMAKFVIISNDNETELPSDLYEIASVVINRTDGTGNYEVAFEVSVNDEDSLNGVGFSYKNPNNKKHVYSRWNKNVYIKSVSLSDTDNSSNSLDVNIKYYGSLPVLDYTSDTINMTQLPPIVEQHYHYIIAHYIAYMYFTNSQNMEDMESQYKIYLIKRNEIKDYVKKHRKNRTKRRLIRSAR